MGLKTVERIGPLLDLFTAERPEWELSEIASALSLPRSTVHGLLRSLVSTGLLASPSRGRYRLGGRIAALHGVISEQFDVRSEASATIRRLSQELRETVNIGVLRGAQLIYLDTVPGYQHVTVISARIGAQVEAHRSAIGKALLAFTPPDHGAPPPSTALSELLASLRPNGYATDLGEVSPEIKCVAAPVIGPRSATVAAISISTTPVRYERRKDLLVESVMQAAESISERLRG